MFKFENQVFKIFFSSILTAFTINFWTKKLIHIFSLANYLFDLEKKKNIYLNFDSFEY